MPEPDDERAVGDEPTEQGGADDEGVREAPDSAEDPSAKDPVADDPVADGQVADDQEPADGPVAQDAEPEPALRAHRLGLRLRSGWVFRHLDLTVLPGQSVELVGSGGTGRSMLLLALVGRARHSTGTLDVLGDRIPPGRSGAALARRVRQRTAVARVGPLIEPDEQLTVAQAAAERRRWDQRGDTRTPFEEAAALVGLDVPATVRLEHLAAVDRTLLAVALALMAPHEVLVLDDVDLGLSSAEHRRVGEALAAVAATGATVVSMATRASGAPGALVVGVHTLAPVHAAAPQEVR